MDKEKVKNVADNVQKLIALYDNQIQLHNLLFKECLKYLNDIVAVRPPPNSQAPAYWAKLHTLKEVLADVIKKGEGES